MHVLSFFILLGYFQTCQSLPDGPQFDEYPHVVKLEINNLFLYKLTTPDSNSLTPENIDTVLQAILSKFHLNRDQINIACVRKTLVEKLRHLLRKLKLLSRSGFKKKELLEKWANSDYVLNVPHRTGSPTKRKLEEVQEELNRSHDELNVSRQVLADTTNQNQELKRKTERLSNPKKRKHGERGKSKQKNSYSDVQKRRHKKHKVETVKSMLESVSDEYFKPTSYHFNNEFNEDVEICIPFDQETSEECTQDELDELIFILDMYNIPNRGYHELTQTKYSRLPKLCRLVKRRNQLNNSISIHETNPMSPGVYTSLSESLCEKLSDPSKSYVIKNGSVRVKISGDGTRITCKQSFVNISYTMVDEATCMSEHGNYLLAIVKCKESNEGIKSALSSLIEEIENLEFVMIAGQKITIDKYLGGDLKFLNQVVGIGGFASKFTCLWCRCSKEDRFDMQKTWSMTNPDLGARTIEEITTCGKMKKSDPLKFNCTELPIFPSIPICKVIPDTLHLCLRICDQMVSHLFVYLLKLDNFSKCSVTEKKLDNSHHVKKFQVFISDQVKILDWKYFIKDGRIEYRTFRGPEHRRILQHMDLDFIIPTHPKLNSLKKLWKTFSNLLTEMEKDLSEEEIDAFEIAAKEWVHLYYEINCSTDITPYMHLLAFHVPEVMRLHGNISHFCQQGLEKLNDLVTKWYHRSTNFGPSALAQILSKQHRLHILH